MLNAAAVEQQYKMQDLAKAEFAKWWRAHPNATEGEVRAALLPSAAWIFGRCICDDRLAYATRRAAA